MGEDGDCTLQFGNNTRAGTGEVRITATTVSNKCSGTSEPITFEIKEGTAPITPIPSEPEDPTPVTPTPVTPITSGDVSFADADPYTLKDGSKVEPKVSVTVSGTKLTEGTDYTVSYKNSNAVGEATVTVTGKGNYTGTVNKTYTIIAVKEDSVNIALGSGEEAVSLEVPTKYLPSDRTLTDETLSNALNKQSAQEKPADAPSGPSYTYEVSGLISGLKGEKPVIKVKVERKSLIRLILNKVASIINQDAQILEMEEMTEAEEVSNNSVVVYATLEQLDTDEDNKVTKKEVEAYIKKKPEYKNAQVPEGFKPQDYSKALELGSEVSISKDGFIEINADVEVAKPSHKPSSGGSSSKPVTKPEEPAIPVIGTPTTMYRLYNTLTGEHLYTIDKSEKDKLLTSETWSDEGQGWIAPSVSDYPVYRLLNPNTSDHHYTTDKNEFDTLQTKGWIGEGVAFYSADTNNNENVLLHRLYNPNETGAGSHHYTADTSERGALVNLGWQYEGTAWAGLPKDK